MFDRFFSSTPWLSNTLNGNGGLVKSLDGTIERRAGESAGTSHEGKRKLPKTGASVFPVAIAAAVQTGSELSALLANAPSQIPGQTRYPQSKRAASAMPVGGHTAVTCFVVNANEKPSFAAAT